MVKNVAPLALALALGAMACSKTYIPNTDVEDTSQNRKVIAFCCIELLISLKPSSISQRCW